MPAGLRIRIPTQKVDEDLLARYRRLSTAIISDSMSRLSAGGAQLRPIGRANMCGTALTVKTAPGDNLFPHKALDMARKGDVIVIDAGGELTNAIVGERMVRLAESKGIAGIIVNGAVRDVAELRQSTVPVFAAGVTHRGPYKNGPGEINYTIGIDGMVVSAGDVIVGDDDGLVCVPRDVAMAVCIEAERRHAEEHRIDPCEEDRDWIDAKLKALGCEITATFEQVSAHGQLGNDSMTLEGMDMSHLGSIDHIDIVVEDTEKMAEFLISIGFTMVRKAEGRGSIEVAFPGKGDQPILELTAADSGNGKKRPLGLRHIAVRSTNLDATYSELTARGYTFDKPPRQIPETGRMLTNLKDPEGRSLQIVDVPKG